MQTVLTSTTHTAIKVGLLYGINLFTYKERIEKNVMGGACGAYGGGQRCAQGVDGET
jgi:hypothetical protein